MELEKNSDPDDDEDDDEDDDDGGDNNVRETFVAGKKPGYGMKTKPTTVAMMHETPSTMELAKELKMTGGLPDLGNL